jgi:transposase InsO family protein
MSGKYQFIAAHASQYPVTVQCRVLRVSRSGYYAWRTRPPSQRRQADGQFEAHIRQIHTASRRTYGSPRIHAELREQGVRCSKKRVARLMRRAGIRACRPRRSRTTTDSRHALPIAANLLNREFAAPAANTKWAGDITYIETNEGWLYLAVVLDLFSRRVIGWAMQRTLARGLVLDALKMALDQRRCTTQLVHHSDRGSQYASGDYQAQLAAVGIQCSMSRRGDCFDNAPVESFFGTLKTEVVYQHRFATRSEARQAIFEYIEVFYNRQRRHSALGYVSPAAFEAQHASALRTTKAA